MRPSKAQWIWQKPRAARGSHRWSTQSYERFPSGPTLKPLQDRQRRKIWPSVSPIPCGWYNVGSKITELRKRNTCCDTITRARRWSSSRRSGRSRSWRGHCTRPTSITRPTLRASVSRLPIPKWKHYPDTGKAASSCKTPRSAGYSIS